MVVDGSAGGIAVGVHGIVGADAVAGRIKAALGIDWHETTPDGRVTLEPVFCLGLCACGPAAMVDGQLVGRCDETLVAKVSE